MWPSKPEVLISPTVWQISLQFRRQTWGFRPRPERRNWPRATATTTDNRKLQYERFVRQSCNFWLSVVVAIIWLVWTHGAAHRHTTAQSATLGLYPTIACKLLLISHPAKGRRLSWSKHTAATCSRLLANDPQWDMNPQPESYEPDTLTTRPLNR